MPLHNTQTYKAFQTLILVYVYCYIMQKSWWIYNTNYITQTSEDLAPYKILSDPCPSLLSFYKEMASAKENWKMYNREYQEDIAQPTKQPDKANSVRFTFTLYSRSICCSPRTSYYPCHISLYHNRWKNIKLRNYGTCVPTEVTVQLSDRGSRGTAAPILHPGIRWK